MLYQYIAPVPSFFDRKHLTTMTVLILTRLTKPIYFITWRGINS